MIKLQIYWRSDAADGYVGVVEGCIRDGREGEEDRRRDEQQDTTEVRS
jgi:hypothetical protein